jgi:DNA polymerase III sliding clamp (beta) subunit (PCNA family)
MIYSAFMYADKQISGPPVTQLNEALKQAEDQWNKEHKVQPVKHLLDSLKHLDKEDMQIYLSEHAKAILSDSVNALMTAWLHQ